VAALGAVFVVGLLPGLYAQAELAQPGLQVVGEVGDYNVAISIHTLVFAGAMPLIGIALALAVIAEARESRIARIGALAALAGAALRTIALGEWTLHPTSMSDALMRSMKPPDLLMLAQAIAGLAALVLVAVMARRRRAPAVIFAILSGIATLLAAMMQVVLLGSGVDHALHDTYYVLGAEHQAGVAVVLNILGALSVWSMRWEGLKRTWYSLVAGIATVAAGLLVSVADGALGIMGMPLKYVDYTPQFAAQHAFVAVNSIAFAAVLAASLIWLAILTLLARKPPGVETAFE
jgi:heme/copper-type cytochrome/quinol oxidase subunit 1